MSYLPPFFHEHELAREAGERDVKRAYARALRKIDQENDPGGFQALRESYEYALQWQKNMSLRAVFEVENKVVDVKVALQNQSLSVEPNQSPKAVSPELEQQVDVDVKVIPVEEELEATLLLPDPGALEPLVAENLEASSHPENLPPVETCDPVVQEIEPISTTDHEESVSEPGSIPKPEPALEPESTPEPEAPDSDVKRSFDPVALARLRRAATENVAPLSSPEDLAQALFGKFRQQLLDTVDTPNHASIALDAALNDERMIQVEVRHLFECSIARYILAGWHDGDGDLFDAALRQFEWDKDKQRMFSLDSQAFVLDRALTELVVFNEKSKKFKNKQLALIHKARSNEFPGIDFLDVRLPQIEQMLKLFPNWLSLVTKVSNIREWRKTYNKMTQYREGAGASDYAQRAFRGTVVSKPPAPASNWILNNKVLSFIIAIAILKLLLGLGGSSSTNNHTQKQQKPVHDQAVGSDLTQFAKDYFLGRNGMQVNVDKALKFWVQASDKGDREASYQLGWIYFVGNKVEKNTKTAHDWFVVAAQQGKESAFIMVGDDLLNGEGVAKNPVEAFGWYKKAADKGSSIAQLKLAGLYEKGIGVKTNKAEAVKMLTLSAEQGQVEAESALGQLYWFGQYGLKKDEDRAVLWLSRAALKGNSVAQGLYGRAYELGVGGLNKQAATALEWYRKAAKNNDKQAKTWLQQLCAKEKLASCSSAI